MHKFILLESQEKGVKDVSIVYQHGYERRPTLELPRRVVNHNDLLNNRTGKCYEGFVSRVRLDVVIPVLRRFELDSEGVGDSIL